MFMYIKDMKKKEILTEIIDCLFAFDEERESSEDYTFNDFLGYLNARSAGDSIEIRKIRGDESPDMGQDYGSTSSDISILIVLMYRYAKGYIKKALKSSRLQTADEFSFLITLMTFKSLTKTELINKQVMEKTSGTEIIKRLKNSGFISETDDINDKRSVRVSITDAGRAEIFGILPTMGMVSKIVTGNLNSEEINTLAYLLKKLDYFHNDIYMNRRKESLENLIQAVQPYLPV